MDNIGSIGLTNESNGGIDMTFAEQMVAKYQAILLASAGLKMVSVDGQTVSYADLEEKYQFWVRKVEQESGTRGSVAAIDLTGF